MIDEPEVPTIAERNRQNETIKTAKAIRLQHRFRARLCPTLRSQQHKSIVRNIRLSRNNARHRSLLKTASNMVPDSLFRQMRLGHNVFCGSFTPVMAYTSTVCIIQVAILKSVKTGLNSLHQMDCTL